MAKLRALYNENQFLVIMGALGVLMVAGTIGLGVFLQLTGA